MTQHGSDLEEVARLRRKLAELEASRTAAQHLIESATEYAIFTLDLKGRVQTWNEGARRILGWEEDEILGQRADVIFTPQDRAAGIPQAEMSTAIGAGRALDERWHLRRDGSRFWATGSLMPVNDEDGTVRGFLKILRDRTELKLAEGAVQQRSRRMEILSQTAAALLAAGPDEGLETLFRSLSEEFALSSMFNFVADDADGALRLRSCIGIPEEVKKGIAERRLVETVCSAAAETGLPAHKTDIQSSDDPQVSLVKSLGLRAYACFPLLARGVLLGTLSFGTRDRNRFCADDLAFFRTVAQYTAAIRERVNAENALRRSESRLRLALEASRMAVWESDAAGDMLKTSPELNRLLGFAENASPTTEEIRACFCPGTSERLRDAVTAAMTRGERRVEEEFRIVWLDGSIRWILLRAQIEVDAQGSPTRVVGVALDITQRKEAEERRELLTHELNHRVKNTLATVQSIVSQTLRSAHLAERVGKDLEARLLALARTHDVLTRENWEGAPLKEIAAQAFSPYSHRGRYRFRLDGPDIRLAPRMALALAMALQELATNAVKYGALSNDTGEVRLTWATPSTDAARLVLRWEETGGPPVGAPPRRGFGTRLIERSLVHELGGQARIDFAPTGLVCTVDAPLQLGD